MEIKLERIVLDNFKQFQHLEIVVNGQNMDVVGANKTGKTTVMDSFNWCLFDKDSLGSTQFAWKPLDNKGNERHNLETSVEVVFNVDGLTRKFKRVRTEKYTKKRNSPDVEFTGHQDDCYVDDVPKAVNEYKKIVTDLIDEELFRMLTNVNYFNSLPVKKQREILFKLCPNLTDEDVISATPGLEELTQYLVGGKTVDDVLKIAKNDKTNINKRLEVELPAQIKALKNTKYLSIDESYNDEQNTKAIEDAYSQLSQIEANKASKNNNSKIAEIEKSILDMENNITKFELEKERYVDAETKKQLDAVGDKKNVLRKLKSDALVLEDQKNGIKTRIENGKKQIKLEEERKEELYKEYDEVNGKSFIAENCAYCGQALPEGMVKELEAKFNLEKSNKLEGIRTLGKGCNTKIETYQTAIKKLEEELEKLQIAVTTKYESIDAVEAEIKDLEAKPFVEISTKEFDDKVDRELERISTSKKGLQKIKETDQSSLFDDSIKQLKNTLAYLNDKRAEYKLKLQNDERVKLLEQEEKVLRKNYEDAETKQILCEKFVVAKANLLSETINDNFTLINFKLFDVQVNGGIQETCVATVNGVPYYSVNNGGRINAGLDIIHSLQRIYGIKAPIFIDNSESVSDWLVPVDSQLIRMYVDPTGTIRELTFEYARDNFVANYQEEFAKELGV